MNTTIFSRFISNCLHINVLCIDSSEDELVQFEKKNCFDATLQPMYTAEYLSFLISNSKPETFYEITDYVNTSLLLFMFQDNYFIVGPYVKTLSSDRNLHELLVSLGLSAKIFPQIKLYYSHYPLLEYTYLTDIILAAMRAFAPMTTDFSHRYLKGFHEEITQKELLTSAENSYMEILKRYEYENFFLDKIRKGDVEGVASAFHNSSFAFRKNSDSFLQSIYVNHHEGFSVIRTLGRKAAEEGGCPVVQIDEITQEAIQKVNHLKRPSEIATIIENMILALTKAVADSQEINRYPLSIKHIATYINSNFAHEICLSDIAEKCHMSREHLSRTFKKETGFTITEYIAKARIKKAAELLTTTSLSVSEISAFVGYSDNNYFTKVFKKHYHMTPSEYRQSKNPSF